MIPHYLHSSSGILTFMASEPIDHGNVLNSCTNPDILNPILCFCQCHSIIFCIEKHHYLFNGSFNSMMFLEMHYNSVKWQPNSTFLAYNQIVSPVHSNG